MRLIPFIWCIAIIVLLSGTCGAAEIATVHGVAYEWSTFEPLDNAIIEVNSTPSQSMVAKYGVYSFELSNGTYKITASYYEEDQLTYYAEDTIIVSDDGSYVLDLLLLPSYSTSSETSTSEVTSSEAASSNSLLIGGLVVVVLLLLVLGVQIMKKPKPVSHRKVKLEASPYVVISDNIKSPAPEIIEESQDEVPEKDLSATIESETPDEFSGDELPDEMPVIPQQEMIKAEVTIPSDEPVPADLQEIIDILKSQGGRMTQKDMRKRLKYSEGKVSLMLLDLEKRGKIQKFKKGRGNVLFLVEQEE